MQIDGHMGRENGKPMSGMLSVKTGGSIVKSGYGPFPGARTLGAACIALATVHGIGATPVSHADNSIEQQVTRILSQARSYQAVMDVKESGAGVSPAESSFHMVEIVVRHGSVSETYTKLTVAGHTVEMAMKGNKICQGVAGHWNCADMGPGSGAMLKEAPDQFAKALGLHVVSRPAGTKTIAGQPAVGFSFSASTSGTKETGTFWLDPSRQRLIAMDAMTTDNLDGKTSTLSSKALFTHWNDPSLKIPAVPGL